MKEADSSKVDNRKFSTMAIVSLVLSFFIPILGLVLGIIALTTLAKRNEKGRGLAISAIIVSAVIMVLQVLFVVLVLSGFSGVQKEARDTERKADIRLIESKLAEYMADNGSYPGSLYDIPGLPQDALDGPVAGEIYVYTSSPAGCYSQETGCTGYTITSFNMETESNPYTRSQ